MMPITLLLVLMAVGGGASPPKPHILFIVADDFGWNDIGYHQNQKSAANPDGLPTTNDEAGVILTPVMDKLSSEGVRLENYYVQPLCSPTRGTFMTGRYPMHTGVGPDVIEIQEPYGMPARETLLPELLKKAGYATHAVGKWHLGTCDERYEPTFRGFDSYSGYLAGAEDYYHHSHDWRNGSKADVAPSCGGEAVADIYSTTLYTREVERVVAGHQDTSVPFFLYLAFQNVHNPYEAPPPEIVDINKTYASVTDYTRRIYCGMVTALDIAVGDVVESFKRHGLWEDTLLVWTTDNGGIGPGNNYPLRGMKVLNWEGGVHGTAFVRGTDSGLAKVPSGEVRMQLMHSTDWLPTLCHVAGVSTEGTLPLDGHNQWDSISKNAPTERTFIIHNMPVKATPVNWTSQGKTGFTTNTCVGGLDTTFRCNTFGIIGGAIRKGDLKLVVEGKAEKGIEGSSPAGVPQYTPKGFKPTTHNTVPEPVNGLWLFNITADPTETHNLAASHPDALKDMLDFYNSWAAKPDTVAGLGFKWGFVDPASSHHADTCMGPFVGSRYCSYGYEFDCFLRGSSLGGADIAAVGASDPTACQAACKANGSCEWWVLDGSTCHLKSTRGQEAPCPACYFGPKTCPGE